MKMKISRGKRGLVRKNSRKKIGTSHHDASRIYARAQKEHTRQDNQ